ncbi:MAG TPA: APC family permease [Solirubrobacteraceae bacterium]|jgi:amino acid transporter|nr:APC family permease [Solirubrobacteraceae bacterium]
MESATVSDAQGGTDRLVRGSAPGSKGLKADALGYASNLVIAIASTAPAYSLAATLGFIVAIAGVGTHAPAVLIVSFIPILFVSVGYRFFNLADPDAGTTFAWVTRAFGPQLGWINGWAIFLADIIVMASLAAIASNYTFLLFHSAGPPNNFWLIVGAVVWIALMTWICYRGIELSARIQTMLLSLEIFTLVLFVIVALVKVYANHPAHSLHISASWFNPFDLSWGALVPGVLLGIFIYWGWDSGVAVNEESRDRTHGPGKAAVVATVILLLIYVLVSVAAQAFHGPAFLANNSNDVLNALGKGVFGSGLDKLLIICVLTSASASTQTTILPTARTTLSMAKWNAIPSAFGRIHPRFLTPSFSTVLMGGLSTLWTIALLAFNPNQDVLGDTISALGFSVCFYYGFTGIACAVYFRRQLFKSVRNFLFAGLIPVAGGVMMGYVAVRSFSYYNNHTNDYSKALLGIQTPILVGIGGLVLGVILMFAAWPFFPKFFHSKWWETADPAVLDGEAARRHSVRGEPL